jgi:alpha 1,2-mannosyltransferase
LAKAGRRPPDVGTFVPPPDALRRRSRTALVYLAQKFHKDYKRNTFENLQKSLDLLHKNYRALKNHDVLIFHNGDFTETDRQQLSRGKEGVSVQLVELRPGSPFWRLPSFPTLRNYSAEKALHPHFGVGYRHMIRWYARLIFYFLDHFGYEWVIRMDEESYVYTPIEYDMTARLEEVGAQYGYRMTARDPVHLLYPEAVHDYLSCTQTQPTFLYRYCNPPSLDGVSSVVWDKFKGFENARGWQLTGYYNNFFVSKISFWLRPEVERFVYFADLTGDIYHSRWNDLIIQATAIQLYLRAEEVHWYDDFTYEHATITGDGYCMFGGIISGSRDDPPELYEFSQRHHRRIVQIGRDRAALCTYEEFV